MNIVDRSADEDLRASSKASMTSSTGVSPHELGAAVTG